MAQEYRQSPENALNSDFKKYVATLQEFVTSYETLDTSWKNAGVRPNPQDIDQAEKLLLRLCEVGNSIHSALMASNIALWKANDKGRIIKDWESVQKLKGELETSLEVLRCQITSMSR